MHCCCTDVDPGAPADRAPSMSPAPGPPSDAKRAPWPRRITTFMEWTLSLATLALIPKCPACVAAYVLLFTGIGLSLTAATALRWAVIALSIAALVCLVLRAARRAITPPA
jgi:hypothetical protein